jgi:hypothetical protein
MNSKEVKVVAEVRDWYFDRNGNLRGKIYNDTRSLQMTDGSLAYVLVQSKSEFLDHYIVKSVAGTAFIINKNCRRIP